MLEAERFAFLEQAADAAYCVTSHDEIRSWNRAAELLTGYPSKLAIGRNIDDLLASSAWLAGRTSPARPRARVS